LKYVLSETMGVYIKASIDTSHWYWMV